jgi:hypothetical protein
MPAVQLAMYEVLPDCLKQYDWQIYSAFNSSDVSDKCWD